MCMECDYKFARKSTKDIHVWKVFEKVGKQYRTPWYNAYIDSGCNVIIAHSGSLSAYDDFSGVHNVEDQGVHALTDKSMQSGRCNGYVMIIKKENMLFYLL